MSSTFVLPCSNATQEEGKSIQCNTSGESCKCQITCPVDGQPVMSDTYLNCDDRKQSV